MCPVYWLLFFVYGTTPSTHPCRFLLSSSSAQEDTFGAASLLASGTLLEIEMTPIRWLAFSIPTFLYIQERPGDVLPKGEHYFTYNFHRCIRHLVP